MLLYFIKLRHDWPFKMLGLFFGVSLQTASNYYAQVCLKIHTEFTPRLFYFPKPEEVLEYISAEFKKAFPGVVLIGDGTHRKTDTPELSSLNGLTFCVYKWGCTLQVVFCESFSLW